MPTKNAKSLTPIIRVICRNSAEIDVWCSEIASVAISHSNTSQSARHSSSCTIMPTKNDTNN